jgi:enoyl-CoA hydratase/carnithine racemase
VVAAPNASFGLPEASVGIYASAGGLPRVMRNCGLQIASEIALTGRRLTAEEAESFHLINKIAKTEQTLMEDAISLARKIIGISPDAILVTRQGLREAWETASVERATQLTADRWMEKLLKSENTKIGLTAFATKQKPNWVPSKL